jgi:zinc protease
MIPFAIRSLAIALAIIVCSNFSDVFPSVGAVFAKDVPAQVNKLEVGRLTENVTKTELANGLTVLLKEVKTAPVVTVQVWYRVGSQNEKPGTTGISHQLEHLLFKGTKARPIQFGRLFSALGSSSNAFTSYDMTAYFGTVGADKLDALLELESDRMVNTVAGEAELKSERTVVLSELDGGNNNPGTRLYKAVMKAALPNSSYGWTVIGDRRDVENFSVEDVQSYYRQFYRPDNATLIVVGNFDRAKTLEKIQATFGKIPTATQPLVKQLFTPALTTPPLPTAPIVLKEPGSVPLLQVVHPGLPRLVDTDVPALDLMDAVLTAGKSSRLYQSMVQTGLVSGVSGSSSNMLNGGWYMFNATPAQGKTLAQVDRELKAQVEKIQTTGITKAELERAKTQLIANYILSNRDIGSQAQQLGYNQVVAGDYRFSDRYLAALQKVTTQDVQQVAKKYLPSDRRVVGMFEPTAIVGQAADSGSPGTAPRANYSSNTPIDPAEVRRYLPESAFNSTVAVKPIQPDRLVLDNGLEVLLVSDRSTPSVILSGEIKAGTGRDSAAKAGTASLVAQTIMTGTKTQTNLAIASKLEEKGASLGFSANREAVGVSGVALSKDLPLLIQQFADVIQNATFPASEVELVRQRNLVGLKAELDSPGSVARRTFQQKLFPPDHPYYVMRTPETLQAIKREDIANFYRDNYLPNRTTLALTGDFDPQDAKKLLRENLATWQGNNQPSEVTYPSVLLPKETQQAQVFLKGKTQAVTIIGQPGINRRDSRYHAALLLNQVLGGDTLSSRLGTELRDRQGLTYGIYSAFQVGKQQGTFVIQMQTSLADKDRAIASALEIFRQIRDKGITDAELKAAKNSLINSFPVELSTPDEVVAAFLSDRIFGLPPGNFYNFPKEIAAVSLEQVNSAAKELLFPDNLVIVSATSVPTK